MTVAGRGQNLGGQNNRAENQITAARARPTTRKTKAAAEAVQLAAVSADNSAATSSSTTVTAVAATTSPVLPPSPISPVAVDHPPAPSKPPLERAGRTTQSKQLQAEALRAKKEFLSSSRVRVDDVDSFDALAVVFGDVLNDERILVRFDGDVPSLFSAPYSEIVATVNKHLVSLSLPSVLYATKQNDSSIFLVSASAADTQVLDKEWSRWGPTIFPGSRIAPVALPV
ncbi:hypothetical protein R3P38DRAFT_3205582 [Favolaschia claudopus]|uniref:Uncharacterized protein n=1 Tax=Favolaschia claudopus TaxID=2862362 RepID=A0AAW0APP3_9AGAR